ncbi:MAG: glycosyltransferase [Bacteroidales bacterium]|nr:glycosyltransferase [Bacteroidales bacterium]
MPAHITVFTPTYNRAYILPRLYESLLAQTDKNFIWLIVDDGSTDNTPDLAQTWIQEQKLIVNYHRKANGGKHTAMEYAHQICNTPFIVCVDSDDLLINNAIEFINNEVKGIAEKKDIVGIVGRRCDLDGVALSEKWPSSKQKIYFYDLYDVYGYNTDTMLIFKTDMVKRYHFPVFEDEKFVSEKVLYKQFLYQYPMIAITELIYQCEYLQDGYTHNKNLFNRNPKGTLASLRQNAYLTILDNKKSFREKIKEVAACYFWKRLYKISDKDDVYKTKYPFASIYHIIGKCLSYLFCLKHQIKTCTRR